MKKTMIDYVNLMSGDDFDTFENIIVHQYIKFIRFYKLVSPFSDVIKDMNYTFNSPVELEVTLLFGKDTDKKNVEKNVCDQLTKCGYDGSTKSKSKSLFIKLILDEDTGC